MSKSTLSQVFPEKKCKKCGKTFIAAPEHQYRFEGSWFCSWTCYLHRNDDKGLRADAKIKEG